MPLIFGSREANDQLAHDMGIRYDLGGNADPRIEDAVGEDDDTDRYCTVCGGYMDWADCWQCGGDGEFDLYDEDPINFSPGEEYERCNECEGKGGYWECASLPHDEDAAGA